MSILGIKEREICKQNRKMLLTSLSTFIATAFCSGPMINVNFFFSPQVIEPVSVHYAILCSSNSLELMFYDILAEILLPCAIIGLS